MDATCINCGYTGIVNLRVGAVTSHRLERGYTQQRIPDVFICTGCMEATKK